MKILSLVILLIISSEIFCQDENQKLSLKGIAEIGIIINLVVDDDFKNIITTDESIYLQEIRYYLNMAGIKNRTIINENTELPTLVVSVLFRKSRGEMDVSSELRLMQKLSFPKAKTKLLCITWTGNLNTFYLRDDWSSYFQDQLIKSITDNMKLFIADYLEVNRR